MEAISTLFRLFIVLVYAVAGVHVGFATMTMAINPFVGLGTVVFMAFALYDITRGD